MYPTLPVNFLSNSQVGIMDSSIQRGGAQPLSYTNTNITEPAALPGSPLLYSQGVVARPEISQKGGTPQPLSYTNTKITEPAALPGSPLLYSQGVVARPEIPQKGGQQPLSYTNPNVYEPAALAGAPLLYSQGTTARPEIGMKGGFTPSIMGNLVENAGMLVPLAATAAYRLLDNRTRKRGGAKEDFETYRLAAKENLQRIAPGKADGKWIMKLAATRRRGEDNRKIMEEFAREKKVKDFDLGLLRGPRRVIAVPNSPKEEDARERVFIDPKSKWEHNRQVAKEELVKIYPKPSGIDIVQYATLQREGRKEAMKEFLDKYTARAAAKKVKKAAPPKSPLPIAIPEVSRVTGRVVKATAKIKEAMEAPAKPARAAKRPIVNTRPWPVIQQEAKEELNKYGKAKITNINKYAKMKKHGEKDDMAAFLKAFRGEKTKTLKAATPPRAAVTPTTAAVPAATATRKRKVHFSPEKKEWEVYRSGAARMLEGIGGIGATAAEISVLARKMREGEDLRKFLDNYELRVKETIERKKRLERERLEREERDRRDRERRQREHNESKWAEDEEETKSAEAEEEPPRERDYRYDPLGSTETTPERTPTLGWDYTPPKRDRRIVVDEHTPPPKRFVKPLVREEPVKYTAPPPPLPPRPAYKQYGKYHAPRDPAVLKADQYRAMIENIDRILGKK